MFDLPPKADTDQHGRDVRFVPKADISRCGKDPSYSITSSARFDAFFVLLFGRRKKRVTARAGLADVQIRHR